VVPDYAFDVEFRTTDRRASWTSSGHGAGLSTSSSTRGTKPWDLLWFVESAPTACTTRSGSSRTPGHPLYEPGSPFQTAIQDYYELVDRRFGRLLELLDEDTAVLPSRTTGAKAMRGAFGHQRLGSAPRVAHAALDPAAGTPLEKCDVDWAGNARVGLGGYYARVFLECRGPRPEGLVPADRYERRWRSWPGRRGHHGRRGAAAGERVFPPRATSTRSAGATRRT